MTRTYRLVNFSFFRVWFWRSIIWDWNVHFWRQGEGRFLRSGDLMFRTGPPWLHIVRIYIGLYAIHLSFGRYHRVPQ